MSAATATPDREPPPLDEMTPNVEPPEWLWNQLTWILYLAAPLLVQVLVGEYLIDRKALFVFLAAFTVGMAAWVAQDQIRQGNPIGAAAGWGLGVLATGPIAFAIYSLRRRREGVDRLRSIHRDYGGIAVAIAAVAAAVILPTFYGAGDPFIEDCVIALAYVVMALGLNIVVGFAGLLDLGYVAFFAVGAYTIGWLGSGFFADAGAGGEGVHFLVGEPASNLPGVHMNFLVVLVFAVIFTAIAGVLIGLPTLRLRGDYIAIVTLAFGEIIHRLALNGDGVRIGNFWDGTAGKIPGFPELGSEATLTRGKQGITPVDKIDLPELDLPGFLPDLSVGRFVSLDLRPWYFVALTLVLLVLFVNFRLRDSRLGRAWIALREDEVAAASMGIPLVRTKLLAYGTGAACGGLSGAFLGSYLNTVNADQFMFAFSIFVLAMVILGGLGSIWGVVVGAVVLSFIINYLIPDRINTLPSTFGLDFDLTELSFGIFGFLLVIMMVLRPEGLLPERRRKMELVENVAEGGEDLYEARA